MNRIAQELLTVAKEITALGRYGVTYELDEFGIPSLNGNVVYTIPRLATVEDIEKQANQVASMCGTISSKLSRVPVATSSSFSDNYKEIRVYAGNTGVSLSGFFSIYCRKLTDEDTQNVVVAWRDVMGRFGGKAE